MIAKVFQADMKACLYKKKNLTWVFICVWKLGCEFFSSSEHIKPHVSCNIYTCLVVSSDLMLLITAKQSQPFLAPETGLMEDSFFTDPRGIWGMAL